MRRLAWAFLGVMAATALAQQEHRPMDVPDLTQKDGPQQRQRLILKDGSYQLVLSYKVIGKIVEYKSAERDGAVEDIPLQLVDLPATERWFRQHQPGAKPDDERPVLSPELAKEEAERAARTPEVSLGLHLPEEDSMLAVDTFQGTAELVPLPQQGGDLNKETAHTIQKLTINPASSAHRILQLKGDTSDVQLHVPDPVFYVRVGPDEEGDPGGSAFTVDTRSSGSGRPTPSGGSEDSGYVVERVDVRYDQRVVDSFRLGLLGTGKAQPNVIEMKMEVLPGGHWMKLTPVQPLEFGEYALVEVLNSHDLNLNVWDFGVHPTAPENVDAQHPEVKRTPSLSHHIPQP